jgi:hypothetical protein
MNPDDLPQRMASSMCEGQFDAQNQLPPIDWTQLQSLPPGAVSIPQNLGIDVGDPVASGVTPELLKDAMGHVRKFFPPEVQAQIDGVTNLPGDQLMSHLSTVCQSIDKNTMSTLLQNAMPPDLSIADRNAIAQHTLGVFNFFRLHQNTGGQ